MGILWRLVFNMDSFNILPQFHANASQFDQRQGSVQSVSTELTIYQICLSVYHHLLFYRGLCFDRTDVWFRSNELSIETTFDRTDSIPFTRQHWTGIKNWYVISRIFKSSESKTITAEIRTLNVTGNIVGLLLQSSCDRLFWQITDK